MSYSVLCLPKGTIVTSIGKEVPELRGNCVLLLSSSEMKITRRKKISQCYCHPPHTRGALMGAAFVLVEETGGWGAAAGARCACPGKQQPSLVFALVFGCSCSFSLTESFPCPAGNVLVPRGEAVAAAPVMPENSWSPCLWQNPASSPSCGVLAHPRSAWEGQEFGISWLIWMQLCKFCWNLLLCGSQLPRENQHSASQIVSFGKCRYQGES